VPVLVRPRGLLVLQRRIYRGRRYTTVGASRGSAARSASGVALAGVAVRRAVVM